MAERLTEIRRFNWNTGLPWVVDILEGSHLDGYVLPDGTAGNIHDGGKYDNKDDAEKAEALYLIKCHEKELDVDTPAGDSDSKKFGHPDFYKLLEQMADLHSRKNHDYAGTKDPLKNLRACVRLNLEPFLGVLVRLQDKWSRLEEFVNSGQLMVKNESVIDTLMDNAVYSLLAIILYEEQLKEGETSGKTLKKEKPNYQETTDVAGLNKWAI